MDIKDLEPFKAELVAVGGVIGATVGMLSDHEILSIIVSVPGIVAMYGSYVKGSSSAEDVAKAIAKETKS